MIIEILLKNRQLKVIFRVALFTLAAEKFILQQPDAFF